MAGLDRFYCTLTRICTKQSVKLEWLLLWYKFSKEICSFFFIASVVDTEFLVSDLYLFLPTGTFAYGLMVGRLIVGNVFVDFCSP